MAGYARLARHVQDGKGADEGHGRPEKWEISTMQEPNARPGGDQSYQLLGDYQINTLRLFLHNHSIA